MESTLNGLDSYHDGSAEEGEGTPALNGSGGGEGDAEEGGKQKRRRNRKPVTCAQCRKRKLKCDRGSPCGACRDRNEGHLCDWENAVRLPASNYTRDQEAQELRSQLDRFESLLGVLQQSSFDPDSLAGPPARLHDLDVERTSAAEALGLLAGTPGGGGGVSGSGAGPSHLGTMGGTSSSIDQIISIVPNRTELDMLIAAFLSEEIFLLPIVHIPTFRDRYRAFDRTTARNDPFFVALLLAIAGWQTYWKAVDPRMQRSGKEGTARTYLHSAMEALHVGGYMETPTLDVVRTLLLLHKYHLHQDAASCSFFLSAAVQTSQHLGLTRDPARYNKFGYIEQEERRRLWALVSAQDWLESPGRTYSCFPTQCDALLPVNARDEDITSNGIITTTSAPTTMFYATYRMQIAASARAITDRAFGIQMIPSWSIVLDLNNELSRLDSSLPPTLAFEWVQGAVKPFSDERNNTLEASRVLLHLELRQQFMRLHRPFLSRGCADNRFAFSREKCCWAARYTLAIHRGLGDDYRATRSHSLTFHTSNALCILATDLFQEPHGSNAEVHRADVTASLKLLEARQIKSKLVKEGIRVVTVLLRRAFSAPDNYKKRKHDDLRGYGNGSTSQGTPGPSDLAFILTNQSPPAFGASSSGGGGQIDALLRPFDANAPFSCPLPVPMSVEPFSTTSSPPGPMSSSMSEPELANLWKTLSKVRGFYGVPDHREWEELSKPPGILAWASGIDLLF